MEPSAFWSLGDYAIVGDLWGRPGRDLAASLDVAGKDVVDVGTGTGVTAIALAEQGAASVVGVDITPRLLEEADRRATAAGVDVRWVEADFTAVPLPSESVDLVTSTFGLVFAADPGRAVAEARRLVRGGGLVVFTSWSAGGLFGEIRSAMARYFPEAPIPWHESAEGVRDLVGAEAVVVERTFTLAVGSPEVFVDLLERWSAPFVMAAESLGDRWPEARARLHAVVSAAGRQVGGEFRVEVPYLVTSLGV